LLLLLLASPPPAVAASVPSGRPDGEGHVTGYVTLQGHRFALPGGIWTFVTGQRPDDGDMFRVFRGREQGGRLTGILELKDTGSLPRTAGSSGPALVCTANAIGVELYSPRIPTIDDHDCVRRDVDSGAEAATSRDPLVQDFVGQIRTRGRRMPTTEFFVEVSVRDTRRRLDARFWFDTADAGFAGQSVAAWTPDSIRRDPAKVSYDRRLTAWGASWRGMLLSETLGPLAARP